MKEDLPDLMPRPLKIESRKMSGFKQTEIGLIPEDWGVMRQGEIIVYKKGQECYLMSGRTGKPDKFVNVRKETGIEIVNPDDIVLIWDSSKADNTFTGLKGVLASTMIRARFHHDQGRCQNIKRAKS